MHLKFWSPQQSSVFNGRCFEGHNVCLAFTHRWVAFSLILSFFFSFALICFDSEKDFGIRIDRYPSMPHVNEGFTCALEAKEICWSGREGRPFFSSSSSTFLPCRVLPTLCCYCVTIRSWNAHYMPQQFNALSATQLRMSNPGFGRDWISWDERADSRQKATVYW